MHLFFIPRRKTQFQEIWPCFGCFERWDVWFVCVTENPYRKSVVLIPDATILKGDSGLVTLTVHSPGSGFFKTKKLPNVKTSDQRCWKQDHESVKYDVKTWLTGTKTIWMLGMSKTLTMSLGLPLGPTTSIFVLRPVDVTDKFVNLGSTWILMSLGLEPVGSPSASVTILRFFSNSSSTASKT